MMPSEATQGTARPETAGGREAEPSDRTTATRHAPRVFLTYNRTIDALNFALGTVYTRDCAAIGQENLEKAIAYYETALRHSDPEAEVINVDVGTSLDEATVIAGDEAAMLAEIDEIIARLDEGMPKLLQEMDEIRARLRRPLAI